VSDLGFGFMTLTNCAAPHRHSKSISLFEVGDYLLWPRSARLRGSMAVESWVSLIGSVAGISTTGAFLPQVIRTWRTRSTQDISLGMFLLTVFGLFLWLVYGLERGDWPLIIADAVSLIFAMTILGLKLRYG
jgi:MtN3 and saliva related transmembrane protein